MARSQRQANTNTSNEVSAMSEERNGVEADGFITYTLKAVHDDYDIVVRVQKDAVVGIPAMALLRMAERTYKHIQSNEASSQNVNAKEKDDYVGEEAFLKSWRTKKRQDIISGDILFKQTGPRISPVEKEWLRLIDEDVLKPKLAAAGIAVFPTSGKANIQGKTLNEWRAAYRASPKWAHLGDQAQANVDEAKRKAEGAKAQGVSADALKQALEADL